MRKTLEYYTIEKPRNSSSPLFISPKTKAKINRQLFTFVKASKLNVTFLVISLQF